jgi:hypothetical protein
MYIFRTCPSECFDDVEYFRVVAQESIFKHCQLEPLLGAADLKK